MSALLFALAMLAQDPAQTAAAPPAAAEEPPYPVGAPREDYQLVAWCYGALRGYLDLHDQVMPEVTRIETTWRRPGSNLAEDLKVYGDMQHEGQRNLKLFARAMTAAEKASMRPINTAGAAAIKKGRSVWAAAPTVSKARLAQEWMSWALPVRCIPTADSLEKKALLAGSALQVNVEPIAASPEEDATAPAPTTPAAPTVDDLLALPPEQAPAADIAAAPATDTTAQP